MRCTTDVRIPPVEHRASSAPISSHRLPPLLRDHREEIGHCDVASVRKLKVKQTRIYYYYYNLVEYVTMITHFVRLLFFGVRW